MNVAIIGSTGSIGTAYSQLMAQYFPEAHLHLFARHFVNDLSAAGTSQHILNYQQEDSIHLASKQVSNWDWVIVATGILHQGTLMPEKSLAQLNTEKLQTLFNANTVFPALICKHFAPKLNRHSRSIMAFLSARVGSISDNRLGGWYSYRASKAALNMIIKTAAIEIARNNKQAIIIGLHPGSVVSKLSQPFRASIPAHKLFSADYSVQQQWRVLQGLTPKDSGNCFAWDGQQIQP